MKSNIHKITIAAAIIVLALTTGCSRPAGQHDGAGPIPVKVQEVTHTDSVRELAYCGTIEESKSIPMSFSTVGNVRDVLVSEGDHVRKGQLLATLNNESFLNAYNMALATQKQAEDAYRRLKTIYDNGNLPEIKLVEVETGMEKARAAAAIAKENADDCSLYAIEDGIVGKRGIEPGMNTVPGFSAITIVIIDSVYAKIAVPENEIGDIHKGESVTVTVPALYNAKYTGVVHEIGVVADMLSHTYKVKIRLSNRDGRLKPGMLCNAVMRKKNRRTAVVIPSESVLMDEYGKAYVYRVNIINEEALKQHVAICGLSSSGIAVSGGIKLHDYIVVSGQHKLTERSDIRIVKD